MSTEYLEIRLDNDEVWRLDLDHAAYLLAKAQYPDKEEEHFEQRKFYLRNPDEAKYDLRVVLSWSDIEGLAERIETDERRYQDLYMDAEIAVGDYDE